jgi:hypothetical protein
MRGRIALAATIAWLIASAACAADPSPTFAAFQRLCLSPNAHVAQILARADAEGWTPGPASMADGTPFKAMPEFGVRTRADAPAQDFLIVGSGPIGDLGGAKVSADICVLGAKGVDGGAVAADVAAWVGVSPDPKRTQPGNVTYSFTEEAGARAALIDPTDEQAKALVKSGKAHLMTVQFADDHAIVSYFTPRL